MGHSIEGLVNRVAIEGRNPGTPTISRPSDQTVVGIAGENSKNPLGTDTGILTLRVLKYFSTGFCSVFSIPKWNNLIPASTALRLDARSQFEDLLNISRRAAEMGAKFQATKSFSAGRLDLEKSLLRALGDLRMEWQKDTSDANRFTARISINQNSWGEDIEIRFVSENTLRITSKCILPLQIFDSGKNKKNVQSIITKIDELLSGQGNAAARGHGMSFGEALAVFGLASGATRAQIESAYRDQVKKFHPDQVPPSLPDEFKKFAEEKMKIINEAYSVLVNKQMS